MYVFARASLTSTSTATGHLAKMVPSRRGRGKARCGPRGSASTVPGAASIAGSMIDLISDSSMFSEIDCEIDSHDVSQCLSQCLTMSAARAVILDSDFIHSIFDRVRSHPILK